MPQLGAVPATVAAQLRTSYLSTLISNWKIWVLPQLVNFAVVPPYASPTLTLARVLPLTLSLRPGAALRARRVRQHDRARLERRAQCHG